MKIRNITKHVVNIDNKHILPKQMVTLDDSFRQNNVITKMIKAGELEEIKTAAKQDAEVETNVETATVDDFKTFLGTSPSLTKIKNYAKRNKIELGDAKTEEEMVAVIMACLNVGD